MALTVALAGGCSSQTAQPASKQPNKSEKQQETVTNKAKSIKIHDESIVKNNPIMNVVYPQIDGMKDTAAQEKLNEGIVFSSFIFPLIALYKNPFWKSFSTILH